MIKADDVVELTGGEPTLFEDFLTLLDFLKNRNAQILLRTNGKMLFKWRKNYSKNLVVVLAQHDSTNSFIEEKKEYLLPQDLVITGIPENIKQKENETNPHFVNDEISPLTSRQMERLNACLARIKIWELFGILNIENIIVAKIVLICLARGI